MPYVESTYGVAWSTSSFNITDAAIQQRWQDFHDTIVGAGLTEVTGETGRLASFTSPTINVTGESFYGFRIYRFNDTLQATRPIYLRVDFGANRSGTGANANYCPEFKINLGCGTNGSGTLTGSTWGPFYIDGYQSTAVSSSNLRAVYSDTYGLFAVILVGIAGGVNDGFVIERTRDLTGAPTNEGLYVQASAGKTSLQVHATGLLKWTSSSAFTFARTTYNTSGGAANPAMINPVGNTSSLSYDGNTGALLHYPFSYKPYPPAMALVSVAVTDFGPDVVTAITRYGIPQTYKTAAAAATLAGNVGNSNGRLAICTSI